MSHFGPPGPSEGLNLYEVFAVYTEQVETPIIFRPKVDRVLARTHDEAIFKSGIMMVVHAAKREPLQEPLKAEHLTVFAIPICTITPDKFKIKE